MSARRRRLGAAREIRASASVFAAMGDETRLSLVTKLCEGSALSISRLAEGSTITRQSITKHLRVLEGAGLVRSVRRGRESLFELDPHRLDEARDVLENISRQWDQALAG